MSKVTFYVLTIFPGMIDNFLGYGIVKRGIEKDLINIETINIRDFAKDKHKTVDDTPYGGGAGMVMKPDILASGLNNCRPFVEGRKPDVILLSPQGKRFDQSYANKLSISKEIVLVCGRYRDIDQRFKDIYVTEELSIGDYVISGGEPAAMVVIDAVARLIPGVMNDFESGIEDSFQNGLLDCPWYTRPEIFEGVKVPDVLLSGDHEKISKWRQEQSIENTRKKRSDLLK